MKYPFSIRRKISFLFSLIIKQCYEFESENCNLLFPIDEGWFNESFIINNNNTELDLELTPKKFFTH